LTAAVLHVRLAYNEQEKRKENRSTTSAQFLMAHPITQRQQKQTVQTLKVQRLFRLTTAVMRATLFAIVLLLAVTLSHQACPSGWRQSTHDATKCYLVVLSKGKWFETDSYCAQIVAGATLTSITSAFEVDALKGNCDQIDFLFTKRKN
jgi:hypothetical protein